MLSSFWVDVVQTVVFIINRLPMPTLNGQSPCEILFHCLLDYNFLKTFGCACYPNFFASSNLS